MDGFLAPEESQFFVFNLFFVFITKVQLLLFTTTVQYSRALVQQ